MGVRRRNRMDSGTLSRLREDAATKQDSMRQQIADLNDALQVDVDEFVIETPVVPVPYMADDADLLPPLVDSGWSFAEQSRRLIDSKAYHNGNAS